ncbi:methyltransferase domain-containing protein [bacterium]|nr:methyltransferase domain-containing protein [bacterium]
MQNSISKKYLELLACPYCQSALAEQESHLQCAGCSRAFPVKEGIPLLMPMEDMSEIDKQSLKNWNQSWQARVLPPTGDIEADPAFADALQHIREHAPKGAWENFLEAGCGDGQKSLVIARQKKITCIGVDACFEACKLAKRLFAREGEEGLFVVGDLKCLPLQTGKIKYSYAGGSMEHFPDTQVAVNEAFRVLKKGGRITATIPCISLATLIYAQLWGNIPELPVLRSLAEWFHMRLLKGQHMRFGYEKSFTTRRLKRYFTTAGFKTVRVDEFKTHMEFTFLPDWIKAVARRLVRWKWFWPVVYVDADCPE